jgi:hypothetical protein
MVLHCLRDLQETYRNDEPLDFHEQVMI